MWVNFRSATTRNISATFYLTEKHTSPHASGAMLPNKLAEYLSKRKFRPDKSGPAFSLLKLKENGTRRNSDVLFRCGIECDIDSGATLDDLRTTIDAYWWIAYSTHSHDPENGKFKFRLVLPFLRDVIPDEWPHVWQGCNVLLGGVLDPATKDISRLVYLPSCPEEKEQHAFYEYHDGELIDPDTLIALAQYSKPDTNILALNNALEASLKPLPPLELPEEIARVKSMLSAIPADCDYAQWRDVVWAVASLDWKCCEELARDWSASAPDNFDELSFQKLWDSYNADGGISFGTLVYHAKQHRWNPPAPQQQTSDQTQPTNWVETINRNYAWIEANASIYRLEYENFIEPMKFKTQLDNQSVFIGSKSFGIGTAWLKHANRRQHRQLVIRPQDGLVTRDNCLNEWKGFAVTPASGNATPFLELLERLIPDQDARNYVLSWLSHLLQHPEVKMYAALAMWSLDQGGGKNLLFECISSIIGQTHASVIGQAQLSGSFNGWANRKVLVIGDEVSAVTLWRHMPT
jgi:hypothetical protein